MPVDDYTVAEKDADSSGCIKVASRNTAVKQTFPARAFKLRIVDIQKRHDYTPPNV
jgi:hypothetical protein